MKSFHLAAKSITCSVGEPSEGRQQLLTLENATWRPPSGIRASSIDHTRLSSLDAELDEIGFKYQFTT